MITHYNCNDESYIIICIEEVLYAQVFSNGNNLYDFSKFLLHNNSIMLFLQIAGMTRRQKTIYCTLSFVLVELERCV